MYEQPREETVKTTGGESPSAYASAESSPLQTLQSFSSLKQAEEAAAAGRGLVNSSSAVGIAEYDRTNGLLNDYQSLPPNLTGSETVKEIIEKTVKDELAAANKKSPKTSPETTTQRSSMLSLLGRMFQKSDSSKKKDAVAPSVSSSSPNPEYSPYKLLAAKQPNQQEQDSTHNEHLEKLATLNHKEHEKVDPILSSASIKLVDSETSSSTKSSSIQAASSTGSGTVSSTAMTEPSAPLGKCMPVPASSHEFCMDLNLNLAAAASADLDNKASTTSPQQQSCDHNRFTKNASTSSIHNDLKLILEEGKEKSPTTVANEKSATTTEHKKEKDEGKKEAKPQRDRSHKSNKHGKHHSKHLSKNANQQQQQQSPLSKMLVELDNEKRRQLKPQSQSPMPNSHRYSKELLNRINNERASLISTIIPEIFRTYSCCIAGKHWDPEKYFDMVQYTNDRNQQHVNKPYRNQRTPRSNMNPHPNNNNNNNNNNNYYKKPNYQNQYHNNSNSFSRQNRPYPHNRSINGDAITNVNVDVDRMLLNMVKSKQTPLPSANVNLLDILNKKQTTNIIGDLFSAASAANAQQHDAAAPKHHPLILTAQELEFSQLCTGAGLMQQLQKSSSSKTPERSNGLHSLSQRMNNSLESCGSPSGSSTSSSSRNSTHHHNHHHHQQQQQHHVNTDLNNSSDAYKQLVKNLSNHPLSAASQPSKCSDIDQLLLKLNDANRPRSSASESNRENPNPTQHLKKLLHLDAQQSNKPVNKPRHNHNHHNQQRKVKSSHEVDKSAMEELMYKLRHQKAPSTMSVNQNTEQEHFNGLINKLMPSLANHITTGQKQSQVNVAQPSSMDILKWFKEPNAI